MTAARWDVERLTADLARLGTRGLPREQLYAETAARLRRVVDCDAACWHTLDPSTRLMTSDAPHELAQLGVFPADAIAQARARLVTGEYAGDGVNTFAALAGRRVPVAILSATTRGRPDRSARYRELLAPAGIPHELRAALVVRGRAWGAVHLARREDRPDFAAADAAVLARIAPVVAQALRATVRADAARRGTGAGAPGLVVLGPGDDVELVTAPARALLDGDTPTAPLLALAATAREHRTAPAPVPILAAGGAVTLHASLPDGATSGRVAIVLDSAPTPAATALRLEAHGATAREREVAVLVARGLTNPEIAAALVVSPYTVQDHVRSLLEKTGTASRQELVGRIFVEDYLPHVERGAGLGAHGGFAA